MDTTMLLVRPARMEDADTLLEWRNDETTRQHFRNTELVPREDHIAWLTKVLDGHAGITLCIAVLDGVPVGTVNARASGEYQELSYTIAPAWRKRGLGVQMVLRFVKEYLSGKKIQCEIKSGNVASEKIALALGLHPVAGHSSADEKDPYPLVIWR